MKGDREVSLSSFQYTLKFSTLHSGVAIIVCTHVPGNFHSWWLYMRMGFNGYAVSVRKRRSENHPMFPQC